jgi:hypothetical protein
MTQHAHKLLLEGALAILLLAGGLYNYIVNNLVTPLDVVFFGIALLYFVDVASGGRLAARFGVARLGTRWLLIGVGLLLGLLGATVALLGMR